MFVSCFSIRDKLTRSHKERIRIRIRHHKKHMRTKVSIAMLSTPMWATLFLVLTAIVWLWTPSIAHLVSTYCYQSTSANIKTNAHAHSSMTSMQEGMEGMHSPTVPTNPPNRETLNTRALTNGMETRTERNPANAVSPTVSLPLLASDPPPCTNFCAPTGTCSRTKTQCYADTDCSGCTPSANKRVSVPDSAFAPSPSPFSGNAGTHSSLLTTQMQMNAGTWDDGASAHNAPVTPYMGRDEWTKQFNAGMATHNQKLHDNTELSEFEERIQPKYPIGDEITGVFFSTTPRPANIPYNF